MARKKRMMYNVHDVNIVIDGSDQDDANMRFIIYDDQEDEDSVM
jgi:hypothetical protein